MNWICNWEKPFILYRHICGFLFQRLFSSWLSISSFHELHDSIVFIKYSLSGVKYIIIILFARTNLKRCRKRTRVTSQGCWSANIFTDIRTAKIVNPNKMFTRQVEVNSAWRSPRKMFVYTILSTEGCVNDILNVSLVYVRKKVFGRNFKSRLNACERCFWSVVYLVRSIP